MMTPPARSARDDTPTVTSPARSAGDNIPTVTSPARSAGDDTPTMTSPAKSTIISALLRNVEVGPQKSKSATASSSIERSTPPAKPKVARCRRAQDCPPSPGSLRPSMWIPWLQQAAIRLSCEPAAGQSRHRPLNKPLRQGKTNMFLKFFTTAIHRGTHILAREAVSRPPSPGSKFISDAGG